MRFAYRPFQATPVRVRLLGLLSLLALLWAASLQAAPAQHVVIVSIDGGRPDVILTSNTPNIHELAAQGAYTWFAQTVNPSITLVAHSSMLTGCLPAKHGITWNDKFRPEAGYVKTSTCFEIAKTAGLPTAMFVGKDKLRHIAKPGTVDTFQLITDGALAVCAAAAEYFKTNKPAILFVHEADPDAAGHSKGWGSPEHHAAIETCDQGIGLLRKAIAESGVESSTILIVTADHGGHLKNHGSTDPRDMTIPWVAWGPGIIKPGEIQSPVLTCDTAATTIYAIGLPPDPNWDGKPLTEIFVSVAQPAAQGQAAAH
jgi:predicted AlkP superfamily pyrophosphatase or phosphodiesterase